MELIEKVNSSPSLGDRFFKYEDKLDLFGVIIGLLEERDLLKVKWKPNFIHSKAYDLFYQEEWGTDYKYGGTNLPTPRILKFIGVDEDLIFDLIVENDKNKIIEGIKRL